MKNKYIHFGYYFWGLLLSLMVVFAIITGKVICLLDSEDQLTEFIYRRTDPVFYYLWTALYGSSGVWLLYRSLIFINSNRDYLKKREGFDRKTVGFENDNEKVDLLRVFTVFLSTISIFGALYYIYFIL